MAATRSSASAPLHQVAEVEPCTGEDTAVRELESVLRPDEPELMVT